MIFAYLSVQDNLHSNIYEVNICKISAKMQNSGKGGKLTMNSLNMNALLLYFETKQNNGIKYLEFVLLR